MSSFRRRILLKVLFHLITGETEARGYNLPQASESLSVRKKSSGEQAALAFETGLMHLCLELFLIPLGGSGEKGEVEGWKLTSGLLSG